MSDKKTTELDTILNFIEDEKMLDDYLKLQLPKNTLTFINYLEEIRSNKNLKKGLWIEQADISRSYAYQIFNGTKSPSRDTILKLCISGGFSLEEPNKALTLGGFNKLYAKNRRDSLLIFALNKQLNLINTNLFLDRYEQDSLGNID